MDLEEWVYPKCGEELPTEGCLFPGENFINLNIECEECGFEVEANIPLELFEYDEDKL